MVKLFKVNKIDKAFKRLNEETVHKENFDVYLEKLDFILYRETKNNQYTGRTLLFKVEEVEETEKEQFLCTLTYQHQVPESFLTYCSLSHKERKIFEEIVSHIHLYGLKGRDVTNTFWDIIRLLLDGLEPTEEDFKWYRDLWYEIELQEEMNNLF